MANEWKVVTFNEGAPFDPNDLNQLQLNLTDVFGKSTSLLNATKDSSGQNRVAIVDQGTTEVTISPNKAITASVTFSPTFIAGMDTGFVASVGQALTSTIAPISVSTILNSDKTGGTINVYSTATKAAGVVKINWIATQLKTI